MTKNRLHFQKLKVSKKNASRAGGSSTFSKTELPCRRNARFCMKIEKHFPGGQKIGFVRDVLHFSDPGDEEQHVIETTKHCAMQMRESTKVAYVCNVGAFQHREDLPHNPQHPSPNAKHLEVGKRVWSRRLERNPYFLGWRQTSKKGEHKHV